MGYAYSSQNQVQIHQQRLPPHREQWVKRSTEQCIVLDRATLPQPLQNIHVHDSCVGHDIAVCPRITAYRELTPANQQLPAFRALHWSIFRATNSGICMSVYIVTYNW